MASPDPGRGAGVVAVVIVLVALAVGITLSEFFVAQAYRQAAVRLLAALVLFVAVSPVRAIVRASTERPAPWGASDTDTSVPPQTRDPRFVRFHDEIRSSARSDSYFEHLLWPRLVALARASGAPPDMLRKPAGRRFGRGPSVDALTRLIVSLEARR